MEQTPASVLGGGGALQFLQGGGGLTLWGGGGGGGGVLGSFNFCSFAQKCKNKTPSFVLFPSLVSYRVG